MPLRNMSVANESFSCKKSHLVNFLNVDFLIELSVAGVFLVILMLWFLIGNVSTFIIICCRLKGTKKSWKCLILSLAFLDLLSVLFLLLPSVAKSAVGYWWMGTVVCKLGAVFRPFSGTVTVFTHMVIAIDRYQVVSRPRDGGFTTSFTYGLIAFIWIYSFGCAGPQLLWQDVVGGRTRLDCAACVEFEDNIKILILVMVIVNVFIPMIIICIAYILVIYKMKRHESQITCSLLKKHKPLSSKVTKISIALVTLFVYTWIPFHINCMVLVLSDNQSTIVAAGAAVPYTWCLVIVGASLHPVVYGLTWNKYRAEVKKMIHLLSWCCRFNNKVGYLEQEDGSR